MDLDQVVRFCPRCGSDAFPEKAHHFFLCERCDFHFHINCTPAVVGILTDDDSRILLIRRTKEPGKGKYSVPGGFVDSGETVEAALAREIHEEVNLEMSSCEYLTSYPNPYLYKGVVFPIVDMIFFCKVRTLATLSTSDEVDAYLFLAPDAVDRKQIAFPSIWHGIEHFRRKQTR
jgi:ADP-ribose pyrophosphatase YjhB (NUDIX family)